MSIHVAVHTCPAFGFSYTGHCPNRSCLLWHQASSQQQSSCLRLDCDTHNGIDYATSKNSPLLARLSQSEDPKQQLETSQILLSLALLLAVNVQRFDRPSFSLCKCGVKQEICNRNGACTARQQWGSWLLQLFLPIVSLNNNLTQREHQYILWNSLLQFRKTHKLPIFLQDNFASLALNKRML